MIRIKKLQDIWIDLRWSVIQESRNTKKMVSLNKSSFILDDYQKRIIQKTFCRKYTFWLTLTRTAKRITKEVTFTD